MFEIPFASELGEPQLARLARALQLTIHAHPKLRDSPASFGVARLDFDSGLFLERGRAEGEWALVGSSWGRPAQASVREWRGRALAAARQLDPRVALPR